LLKSHNCGELNKNHIGRKVTLAGWVNRRRDHGGLIFIDLRDREGVTQVTFNPEHSLDCHKQADKLRNEYVVQIEGKVALRPEGTENPNMSTGYVELVAGKLKIYSSAKTPPFYINKEAEIEESLRLKYRYLDLRRPRMRDNLILRHNLTSYIRDFLNKRGFLDIETPILIKSTPEGARDYLVPSRVHPGKFYALPQSPQQLKQLLMVSGMEKYYQIARCFRDEDTRADRQPEFTQLDVEMSFVEEEDILSLMEELFTSLSQAIKPQMKLRDKHFPRLNYREVMERYGTDKPDIRFGMEISDITEIVKDSGFGVFSSVASSGGRIKAICVPKCSGYSKKQLDALNKQATELGAAGLLTIALCQAENTDDLTMEDIKSVASRHMKLTEIKQIIDTLKAKPSDLIMIIAGKNDKSLEIIGELRRLMGKRLELADENELSFCFVTGFPLLFKDGQDNWQSMHHPFTTLPEEDEKYLEEDPAKAGSRHYDLVLNGYEIAGGSIRIYRSDLQRKVFRLLGYSNEDIDERFGHLLEAFEYGAPPHGGIAAGIDRIAMILANESTIREVIPFPKNQNAVDMLFDAPSAVEEQQLKDLHLEVKDTLDT
jgi:aspartyl-tRNA synthetase